MNETIRPMILLPAKRVVLLLCCFPMLMLQCCKPKQECADVQTSQYDLPVALRNVFPYKLGDTLKFLSSVGDTLVSVVSDDELVYEDKPEYGQPGCPPNVNQYQVREYKFSPIKGQLTLAVNLYTMLLTKNDYIPSGFDQSQIIKTSMFDANYYSHFEFNSTYHIQEKKFFNGTSFGNVTYVPRKWGEIARDTVFFTTDYGIIGATISDVSYVLLK